MKKLVLIAILSLVPFTAFALDAMTDTALDGITAQEGVSITFTGDTGGLEIKLGATDTAWIDTDGLGSGTSATTGGYIFIHEDKGQTIRLTDTLTIDVATVTDAGGYAGVATGTTFVAIGLPGVTMKAEARRATISLGTSTTMMTLDDELSAGTALGTIYQNTDTDTVIDGKILIYAH